MKIAVSSKGTSLQAEVDPRLGRAPYILLVEVESHTFEIIDNSANANAFKGAGIQAAATLCEKGAEAVLTGYCGPKAFSVLETAGVPVITDVSGTVSEAVEAYVAGQLEQSTAPNAEAHW